MTNTTDKAQNTTPKNSIDEEKEKVKYIKSITEKGYSPEAAEDLWENRCKREAILKDPNLSDEERKKAIKETRENDKKIMIEDQKQYQKLKYAMHLFEKTNAMVNAILNAKTEEEKQQKNSEYDKFVEENKEWAKDNKEIMHLAREEIKRKKSSPPPSKENQQEQAQDKGQEKQSNAPTDNNAKTLKLPTDEIRQKINAHKEKTKASKTKAKKVMLTPNTQGDNQAPIASLYEARQRRLRA